jgi:hypothetical protein
MQLAAELDVRNFPCPAGGCLLTETSFIPKVRDIFDHSDGLNVRDFRLLKTGRHFRIGPRTKIIIGRDEADNNLLEHAVQKGEARVRWIDGGSPLGVVMGAVNDDLLGVAARILLRYTRAEVGQECRMKVIRDDLEEMSTVCNEYDETRIEALRIN